MSRPSKEMKARAAAAAYGSVRAEGLRPTLKTQKRAAQYVNGKVTKQDLRRTVVREIRQQNSK